MAFLIFNGSTANQDKIGAFSHQEFNTDDFLQSIDIHNILKNRNDLYHRPGFVWDFVPIDSLPRTVRENLRKYRQHIYNENKIQKMIRRICVSMKSIKENIVYPASTMDI